MNRIEFLAGRYRAILAYTGLMFLLVAGLMLTPLLVLVAWPEEGVQAACFIVPAVVMAGAGWILWRMFRPRGAAVLSAVEGGVIVLLSWSGAIFASAMPLMPAASLNLTQAVFEAVSGWTTTGLSVVDVTRVSHMVLLWRSMMQLAGGAGLVVIMLAALAGPIGPGLSIAEGRTDQLVPQVRRSVRLVVLIYGIYMVLGVGGLRVVGLTWFDAINHAFPAISTGGFSTYPDSIGHWDNPLVESVLIGLMILGNLNFLTAYLLLRGRFRSVVRNGEIRLMALLIPVSAVVAYFATCRALYPAPWKAVRVAVFETISALTTTGFQTVTYGSWNGPGVWVLIVLMLIGGGVCSTAGGIKQYRVHLLYRVMLGELRRLLLPRSAVVSESLWQGEYKVFLQDAQIRLVVAFVSLYLATYAVGSLILAMTGSALEPALFEFASALGTVGLSVGVTAPGAHPVALWTMSAGMFLGRLEFLVILVTVMKLGRDLKQLVHLATENRPAGR
mgnify:CR=1 FL=1